MTIREIVDIMDEFAPFATQCSFDNAGLLVGDPDRQVRAMGVVLDLTCDAVRQAKSLGIDLIVSHHPVIFDPLRKIEADSPVALLLQAGIGAIAAHTNLDAAEGGVNDVLANKLGLVEVAPLAGEDPVPMARIGALPKPMNEEEFVRLVAKTLHTGVKYTAGKGMVRTVAVCGGAGGDYLPFALKAGADAMVTADVKHHVFRLAEEKNICLLDAGHFETENPVVEALAERLYPRCDCPVTVLRQDSPVHYWAQEELL